MSVVTIDSRAGEGRSAGGVRLRSLATALCGWGSMVRRDREEAALLGAMSARELRDIGLVRICTPSEARFVRDLDAG